MKVIERHSWLFRLICGVASVAMATPLYVWVQPAGGLVLTCLIGGILGIAIFDYFLKEEQLDLILMLNGLGFTVSRVKYPRLWSAQSVNGIRYFSEPTLSELYATVNNYREVTRRARRSNERQSGAESGLEED